MSPTNPKRPPLRLEMAAGLDDSIYSELQCRSECLQSIATSFIRNMNRVRGLGILPVQLVASATVNEAARVEALVNKQIPLHDPKIVKNHPNFDSDLFAQVDEERRRIISTWMSKPTFAHQFVVAGLSGVDSILGWSADDNTRLSVEALLAAMLIGLWTAFESLAQDTWISAVNACPVPLANNVMSAPDSELKTGNQSKSLSYSHFMGSGFDFRRSMGTLLFAEKKVDFQQLKTIQAAYKVAFAGALEPIFDQGSPELLMLEAARNLFVHKGGVVDRKFINRVKNYDEFKRAKEGDLLSVSGGYVCNQSVAVVNCATNLVQAVDKWLLDRPTDADGGS
jgi:hypothetical protein